jgi:thiol-disulfide isomerase/thioredoxin
LTALLQRTWARNVAGLIVLAAIVGTLFAVDRALSDSSAGPLDHTHPQIGKAAPLFALKDGDGSLHRLDDYRGRVVWINFWATSCGPCRRELPEIQRLATEIGDQRLVVLEVNQQESVGNAQDYWREIGLHLPILFDSNGDVSQQYRLQGLPYSFFIDEDGVLRSIKSGFLSADEMRARLAEVGLTTRG